MRWQIELFFKWIKQNLRIKHWIGYNENAIKIQLYSSLIAYILIRLVQEEICNKYSILKIKCNPHQRLSDISMLMREVFKVLNFTLMQH